VKGLEPSTFSLGSEADRLECPRKSDDPGSTVHRNVHQPRASAARSELLGRLYAAVADLSPESIETLLRVASSMGGASASRRSG